MSPTHHRDRHHPLTQPCLEVNPKQEKLPGLPRLWLVQVRQRPHGFISCFLHFYYYLGDSSGEFFFFRLDGTACTNSWGQRLWACSGVKRPGFLLVYLLRAVWPKGRNHPSIHQQTKWTDKTWCIHTMEQYAVREREPSTDTCHCLSGPWKHQAKQGHKRTNTVGVHLHEVSRIGKATETESRPEVTGGWGRGGTAPAG